MEATFKKIAVFRALYLGDMLCVIPTVRAVKNAFPESSISLVGLPWQKDFARRFTHYFDRFIEFPGWPGLPEQEVNPKRVVEFLHSIQLENFDLVMQMQGHGSITNSMCMLWGSRTVTGLRKAHEYCPNEKLFPVSEDHEHEVLRYLKLTNALDLPSHGTNLEFPLLQGELDHFYNVLRKLKLSPGNYICLHAGARDPKRQWPLQNFTKVGNYLAALGYTIVLTGSEAERDLLRELADQIEHPVVNTIELLSNVSLGDLACFIKHSSLLISNDTGVSHIAAALEVPSVVIFSPYSDQRRWAPLNTSLHQVVSFEEAKDVHNVTNHAISQLQKYSATTSSYLFY
jgi:ADP-heptose:LPS heptosyltransferase